MIVGFYPQLFQIYLFNTSITFGIAFGLFIIVFSIFLTLVYVLISNFYLDKVKKISMNNFFFALIFFINPNQAFAWDDTSTNFAGLTFALFVLITLIITYFASKNLVTKVIIMLQVKKYLVFKMV